MERNPVTPTADDVLCGRGRISFQHEGNRKFRFLIASHLAEYTRARTKKQKIDLVRFIAQTIKERGGRFLKQDRDTQLWYDAGIQAARKKVGHSLRDASNDKIKCVRAMSKSIEKNNALFNSSNNSNNSSNNNHNLKQLEEDELKKTSDHRDDLFSHRTKPDFSSSLSMSLLETQQQQQQQQQLQQLHQHPQQGSGSLWLPATVSSSSSSTTNSITMNTSPIFANAVLESAVESESSCLPAQDDPINSFLEDPLSPLTTVVWDYPPCGSKQSSINSEVLSIFNEINLHDLEDYCDRQEEAMKIPTSTIQSQPESQLSHPSPSDTLVRT